MVLFVLLCKFFMYI